VFYFETLLNQGLAGIDRTAIIATVTGIAYAILLIGFLLGLYRAAMRGGDLQSLGVTAIKYIVVAIIVANWSTVFRGVNSGSTQVAHAIYSSSSAGDVFTTWLDQLQQQFDKDGATSFLHLIANNGSAFITVVLVFVAYLLYVLAIVVFGFFYTLFGCVLYVLGPLVVALLPMPGVAPLAKNFATNIFIWNSWGILYATFAALISAIQANRVNDVFTFMGFFTGSIDAIALGLISIFYALALLIIPFIAKKIVSGDVGSAAYDMVRTAAIAVGAAVSAGAGAAAGAGSGAGTGAGAGAGGSTGTGSATAAGGSTATSATTSSSNPPPQPSVAQTIRSGVSSAINGESPRPPSPDSGSGGSGSKSSSGNGNGGRKDGSGNGSGSGGSSQRGGTTFRPVGVTQQLAYHVGKMAGTALKNSSGSQQDSGEEKTTSGEES
jgi:hypothetical protein